MYLCDLKVHSHGDGCDGLVLSQVKGLHHEVTRLVIRHDHGAVQCGELVDVGERVLDLGQVILQATQTRYWACTWTYRWLASCTKLARVAAGVKCEAATEVA